MPNSFEYLMRCDMIQIATGCRNARVTELLADDVDGDPLRTEFLSVGVSQSMGVDTLLNTGSPSEALHHAPHVTR